MKWIKKEIDATKVKALAERYHIDTLTASILVRRNITEPEQIQFYLEDNLQLLHNPFLFKAMEDVIDRLLNAREEEEKVLVLVTQILMASLQQCCSPKYLKILA